MRPVQNKGFTLLELSIVIVIIGLIIAGISAGQSLVKQASLKQVSSKLSAVTTAINSFRLQYDALPGDITNAFDYWGTAFSCTDAIALDTSSTGCNGDGDGLIENNAGYARQEGYRAWQQLGYLGLMDGLYDGNYSAGLGCAPGTNAPEFYDIGGADLGGSALGQLQVGSPMSNNNCWGPLFTPAETLNFDNKLDDGVPDTGTLLGTNGAAVTNCVSGSSYDLVQTTRQCRLLYNFY